MRRISLQTVYLAAVIVIGCGVVAWAMLQREPRPRRGPTPESKLKLSDIPFNGQRAYDYLRQLCQIGPRPSGSPGMKAQRELMAEHFRKLGGQVELQEFRARNPLDGTPVEMVNLIAHWHPDRKERILLCAHFDTRPYPDRDQDDPRGVFLGANDGASGTALLMELGTLMKDLPGTLGVDFVLFDGEELVYSEGQPYFLGSTWFARQYAGNPPPHRYRWGVLLDMVGDANLQIYPDQISVSWNDTRPLVRQIWSTAGERLGVREFVDSQGYEIRDDHLPLRNIGKIPTCDIIDFDYPYWHTRGDTAERCSALSLAKVGWVLQEWLKTAVK